MKRGAALKTNYTEFPRGRVSYERRRGAFTLRADRCILREKALIIAILSQMRLPVRRTKPAPIAITAAATARGAGR